MGRLEERLRGLVGVELCAPEPTALLNACAAEELALLRPQSVDPFTLRVAVYERDLPRLETLAARRGAALRVLSRQGGSRIAGLLRRRLALLLLGTLTLAALLASSLFVWEIRLVGAESISRGELLRELADCGLRSGVCWPRLDAAALRDRMLLRDGRLAWLAVNIRGSVAEVGLLARETLPEAGGAEALCASRAGIVRRASVLEGRALVEPGQAVLAGETLIESAGGLARGEVWADTWYTLTAVCPFAQEKTSAVRGVKRRFALKIGGVRINFYQNSGKSLDACDTIIHEWPCGIEGLFRLPLSLVCEERRPYQAGKRLPGSGEEAGQRLLAQLAEQIEGEIVSCSIDVGESEGLTVVTLRAHCRENIAMIQELSS